jgi:hypothetical protein
MAEPDAAAICPFTLLEDRHCLCRRLIERFRCHLDAVPHPAFTGEADDARPNRYAQSGYAMGEQQAKHRSATDETIPANPPAGAWATRYPRDDTGRDGSITR